MAASLSAQSALRQISTVVECALANDAAPDHDTTKIRPTHALYAIQDIIAKTSAPALKGGVEPVKPPQNAGGFE